MFLKVTQSKSPLWIELIPFAGHESQFHIAAPEGELVVSLEEDGLFGHPAISLQAQ
jgi:hypothetical protein